MIASRHIPPLVIGSCLGFGIACIGKLTGVVPSATLILSLVGYALLLVSLGQRARRHFPLRQRVAGLTVGFLISLALTSILLAVNQEDLLPVAVVSFGTLVVGVYIAYRMLRS